MWISKQMQKTAAENTVERAVSVDSKDDSITAISTTGGREVCVYSPYGYTYKSPKGAEVLMLSTPSEQSSVGVLMENSGISQGEIKIHTTFGSYIYLKRDGSVEINGLIISKDGVIENE